MRHASFDDRDRGGGTGGRHRVGYQVTPLQGQARPSGYSAVPGEKGGSRIRSAPTRSSGLAEADQPRCRDWPSGHGAPVKASSRRRPNRVFILQRGLLPNIRAAEGASSCRSSGRTSSSRSAGCRGATPTSTSPPGALEVNGKVGDDSDVGVDGHRLQLVAHHHGRRRAGQPDRGSGRSGTRCSAARTRSTSAPTIRRSACSSSMTTARRCSSSRTTASSC